MAFESIYGMIRGVERLLYRRKVEKENTDVKLLEEQGEEK